MSTTLMPIDPEASPERVSRLLPISARLLPEEIVAARRARRTRSWVVVILVLAIALLAGWYVHAVRQRNAAEAALQVLTTQAATLESSQNQDYADVVDTRRQTTTLDNQLKTVMAYDLPWATLLDTLNGTAADAKVQLTGISGSLTAAGPEATAASASGTALPSTSSAATIGTLTLDGIAPDKPSVAAFVIRLGNLRTVANPYLTSAAETDKGVQYSLRLDITGAALCGRFTTACKGGK